MMVLDTHVWVKWIMLGLDELPLTLQEAIATTLVHDATLASQDGKFRQYPELAGRLIG